MERIKPIENHLLYVPDDGLGEHLGGGIVLVHVRQSAKQRPATGPRLSCDSGLSSLEAFRGEFTRKASRPAGRRATRRRSGPDGRDGAGDRQVHRRLPRRHRVLDRLALAVAVADAVDAGARVVEIAHPPARCRTRSPCSPACRPSCHRSATQAAVSHDWMSSSNTCTSKGTFELRFGSTVVSGSPLTEIL